MLDDGRLICSEIPSGQKISEMIFSSPCKGLSSTWIVIMGEEWIDRDLGRDKRKRRGFLAERNPAKPETRTVITCFCDTSLASVMW